MVKEIVFLLSSFVTVRFSTLTTAELYTLPVFALLKAFHGVEV